MSSPHPVVYLVRHGETGWTVTHRHTGLTDVALTENGEQAARKLAAPLADLAPGRVWTSPLQRAKRTCELAGFADVAIVDPDLVEWDYGDYEGLTSAEIRRQRPTWNLFRDGCPGGESLTEISARADRVIQRARAMDNDVLLFSSGHFSRVLTARWLGLDASCGRLFLLGTTTLSVLGYEHDLNEPVIRLWNDASPGLR